MDNGAAERQSSESVDQRRMQRGKSALLLGSLHRAKEEADARLEQARETQDAGTEERQIEAEIADKRVEVFLREHDATGVWKGERLRRDLARDVRDRSWERNEEGLLVVAPEDERSHLLLIHMGELDRLNASGDHALGDQGLRLTAEHAESVIREVLGRDPSRKDERRLAESYDIYRHAGNDFAVDLRDVDASAAEEIRRRLSQDAVDISAVREGEEPIPIAASRVSRADGIELLNALDERPEDVGLSYPRVLIQAMIEKTQTLNDIAKVEMRTGRMLNKIRAAEGTETGERAARDLYDKFLRKSLGDVFSTEPHGSADYEAFRRLVTDHRALEVPASTEWTHLVTERAMGDAFQNLKARRAVGRSVDLKLAQVVARDVTKHEEEFGFVSEGDDVPPSSPDFASPKDTRGLQKIKEYEQRVASAPEGAAGELVRVEAELEKAKRDERTGLYGRGMYFEAMEQGLGEGRSVATVALDMAFLKYFDKEGGPETGNLAIKKAAEVLDTVVETFAAKGITIEAYRVGGDEFALTIIGADDRAISDVVAALQEGQRTAGRVPATAGASARYRSEGLQFNYGVRRALDADTFRNELEAMGVPLKPPSHPDAQNELAEYLVRLADKEVEIQKGVNRMMLLLRRLSEQDEHSNVDLLKAYSQKAIFGKTGEEKLGQFLAELKSSSEPTATLGKLRGEATAFVIEQIDQKNAAVAHFESSLDRRLEDAVRIRFFEQRIAELEEEVDSLRARLQTEAGNAVMLRHAANAAEEEKRAIVMLRERMRTPQASPEKTNVRTAA